MIAQLATPATLPPAAHPAIRTTRHPQAADYGFFIARARVRCAELKLEHLEQGDLYDAGRTESLLPELRKRRQILAAIIAAS